jgi:hypothetical protein
MQRQLVRSVTLAVAMIAAPISAGMGQRDTVPGTATKTIDPWAVALGVNALQLNLATERPGTRVELFASLSRYTTFGDGFNLRAQVFAGVAPPRALTLADRNECPECAVWTSRQTAGFNATLNYEWRRGKALRPYVLGGAGAVFMRHERRVEGTCAPGACIEVYPPASGHPTHWAGLSHSVGVGLAFRALGRNMFAEYGRHGAPLISDMKPIAPFSIGVRF